LGYIKKAHLLAYPNPADNQVTISFQVNDGGNYILKIADVLGRTIKEESGEAVAGKNTNLLSLEGIAKGMYLINLQKGEEAFNASIIVK
jgi:hypothetical protein